MFKRGFALALVLGFASIVNASATLDVGILTAENAPGGYLPGTVVDFDVTLATSTPLEVRILDLDFTGSDPALTFLGPDNFNVGTPGSDGVPEFVFDFSSITHPSFYSQFPNYAQPNITFTVLSPVPGYILQVDGTGLVVGTGQVALPTAPGDYGLSAAGAGAFLAFDFINPTIWTPTGNSLLLTVVPEPGTLVLVGLGGIAVLRRRKKQARAV